jgi:hypothetical protein
MDALKNWSDWIQPGHFLSYTLDGITNYEYVINRDLGHWEYDWPENISSGSDSGPYVPDDLEVTLGYNDKTLVNRIWQLIFGIRGQAFIYIELPTDTHRHGIPKIPKPTSTTRAVSHFTEWMSPFHEPSFITEHFLMREYLNQIAFDAYNPTDATLRRLRLNIFLNKMTTERVGQISVGNRGLEIKPTLPHWQEVLDKLHRRVIPCKPLSLLPVRAPAGT